ncbi:MAG: CHRD domain-containing protein [Sphingomonas sp.]
MILFPDAKCDMVSESFLTWRALDMHVSKTFQIALPILLAALPNVASASIFIYSGTLSGANSVPANGSTATGTYTVTVDDVLNTVSVSLTFTGLTGGPATAAHIHCCVAANANGPVVIPFTGFPSATSGSYSNTFGGVSVANILGIKSGNAYINIHNAVFPGGEIRGQIGAVQGVPEPATWAMVIGGFGFIGGAMRYRRAVKIGFA